MALAALPSPPLLLRPALLRPSLGLRSRQYSHLLSQPRGSVGLITLNRPQSLNALSPELVAELADAARAFDEAEEVGAIVLTGSGSKAFAAGADIKTMSQKGYMDMCDASRPTALSHSPWPRDSVAHFPLLCDALDRSPPSCDAPAHFP